MNQIERTRQQLDPAGSIGVRIVSSLLAAGAFIYGVLMTLYSNPEIGRPYLAGFALVALGAASLTFIVASDPRRAPFSSLSFLLIEVFAIASVGLAFSAHYGANAYVRDDWAGVAFGILLLAVGPYRPVREVVAGGVVFAIVTGFLTLIEAPDFVTSAPPLAFVIVAVIPVLALCFASVAHSRYLVRAIEQWQRRAGAEAASEVAGAREGIARSVRQDRVTILSRDVLPFFSSLLESGRITNDDRERAGLIADSIRTVIVADADRSWLENVVDLVVAESPAGRRPVEAAVLDEDSLAGDMTTEQRTAVRTLLMALVEAIESESAQGAVKLQIVIRKRPHTAEVTISSELDSYDYLRRLALAPYFAVLRAAFSDLETGFARSALTVRFGYERR